MKPLPHLYTVRIAGGPTGHAALSSEGVADLLTAPPIDFDGPGDVWSPEQLLLAAVQSCFLMTFRAVAQASGIEFSAMSVQGEGTVDRQDGGLRFTEIVLRPRVALPGGVDDVRVRRALEKAERACLVSRSLGTPVRLEPEIASDGDVDADRPRGAEPAPGGGRGWGLSWTIALPSSARIRTVTV